MSAFVLSIILFSTFMHAGWNLMVRHGRSELLAIRRMLVAGALLGLLPTAIWEFAEPLGLRILALALASGVCCGVYFLGLAKGYAGSDFTTVYPVVRALPVLLLGLGDIIFFSSPSVVGWLAIGFVVMGCVLAPLVSWRGFHLRLYFNPATLWMVMAALGTVGYSLIDKVGATRLEAQFGAGPTGAMRYSYWFFLFAAVTYLGLIRLVHLPKPAVQGGDWPMAALAAVLNMACYGLIVWALQLVDQVSYVVAARQFSIVIGVVVALVIFKERGRPVRLTAALLITAGLMMLAILG